MHRSNRLSRRISRRRFAALLVTAALAAASQTTPSAMADVTVTPTEYKGWKEAYRLTNGDIELVVVPELGGRIMRYGYVGGPNQLWENPVQAGKPMVWGEWTNHGGDKTWPWPQDLWGFPPPVASDQAPHRAEVVNGKTLRLTSPRIVPYGVRIIRDITLDPTGTGVALTAQLVRENVGSSIPLAPWTVCQVPAQSVVYARLLPSASGLTDNILKMGDVPFKAIADAGGVLTVERNPANSSKIGTEADLLATVQDDVLFTVAFASAASDNAGLSYVPGERAQIYNHPDSTEDAARGITPYIELEMTAPKRAMKRGETVTLSQRWQLRRLKDEERTPQAVVALLKQVPQ